MFDNITAEDIKGRGITGLPDVPGLSTADMQAKFDELSLEVIIPKLNNLIQALNDVGISGKKIADILTNSKDEIPTSAAILELLADMGGGDMLRATYDKTKSGVVDDAERLGGNAPEYYATQDGLEKGLGEKAFEADLQKEIEERKAEVAVERARINNLTVLPDGSTTGDAELVDIRVGFDGTEHESAGEAVRKQIKAVYDAIPLAINSNGELCFKM